MRIWPRSIFGRLLVVAVVTTIAALALAAVTIGHVLERFVTRELDQQLDAQVNVLARAVRPDGVLDPARAISLPAFETGEPGWGWRVDGLARHWTGGAAFTLPVMHHPWRVGEDDLADDAGPRPAESIDRTGERVHLRQLDVRTSVGPVLVTAAGPRRVAIAPLREAMVPLLASLALLGGALAVATTVQLRVGLRPLRRLRVDLAEVRAGRRRHIPADQPAEIAPLATELNAMIDENEAGLAHARRHVSNLAHGLKTPLAVLSVELSVAGRDPDGQLSELVAQIDGRIRHHLGRARAATPGSGQRTRTALAPAVADLVVALGRIHADRPVHATLDIASGLSVAADPQDLDEMVGNLLDNAWRHARTAVIVTARIADASAVIDIGDDGAGLSEAARDEAMLPGRRLDERGDGHGFGLSIAAELVELHGGTLTLGRSLAGGLSATLTLPIAR